MAVRKLGSIQQLSVIIESRNESVVENDSLKITEAEKFGEAPLIDSRTIYDDQFESEEVPIIESRIIEDEEDILLEARPVETIDEVISNAKEMLATNTSNEALSSI